MKVLEKSPFNELLAQSTFIFESRTMTKVTFYRIIHVICLLITLALVIRCIYNYQQDEDTSQVEYKTFHAKKGYIYPSFSICFKEPIIYPKVKKQVGDKLGKRNRYQKFLDGSLRDKKFLKIDYDDVTTNLSEHLTEFRVELQNNKFLYWKMLNDKNKNNFYLANVLQKDVTGKYTEESTKEMKSTTNPPKLYVSSRRPLEKCFAIDMPFIPQEPIVILRLKFDQAIFHNSHGRIKPNKKQFYVVFHYPEQRILNSFTAQSTWISSFNKSDNYIRSIYVGYVEVLKRRNKANYPCQASRSDKHAIERAVKEIGCRPRYIKFESHEKVCTSAENTTAFENELHKKESCHQKTPACESIKSMYDWYKEMDRPTRGRRKVSLNFLFVDDYFKVITYLKAYSTESLIGNIGGYIGM